MTDLTYDEYDESVRFDLNGQTVKMAPETDSCDGCIGDPSLDVCSALPDGCHNGDYIWIKAIE